MAYQVGTACYGSALQAAQAVASGQAGAIVQHGPTSYVVDVAGVTEASITYAFEPIGGGAALIQEVPFSPQPCNLLSGEDGMVLGWAVAGAWLAAYGVVFLARALRGETGGKYGYGDT